MPTASEPPPYEAWRKDTAGRAEDAARVLGYYLVKHCRAEALKTVSSNASPETCAEIRRAVDEALHNVMDLLEGYWKLSAGSKHDAVLSLHVDISQGGELIESVRISPCGIDLPIGYWAWVDDYRQDSDK